MKKNRYLHRTKEREAMRIAILRRMQPVVRDLDTRKKGIKDLMMLLLKGAMVETIQHQCRSFLGLLVLPRFRVIASGMMLNLELSHQELFHRWWSWEEKIAVGSTSDSPEGIACGSTWDALVRSEREQLRRLLRSSNVFTISTASAIAMCKI
jgi:hypothetical protein